MVRGHGERSHSEVMFPGNGLKSSFGVMFHGHVAWSFTVFYWFGNAAGNRALSIGDNALGASDIFGVIGFLSGLPAVIIVVVLLAVGAKAVLTDK